MHHPESANSSLVAQRVDRPSHSKAAMGNLSMDWRPDKFSSVARLRRSHRETSFSLQFAHFCSSALNSGLSALLLLMSMKLKQSMIRSQRTSQYRRGDLLAQLVKHFLCQEQHTLEHWTLVSLVATRSPFFRTQLLLLRHSVCFC